MARNVDTGRTFTGAWIETHLSPSHHAHAPVAPSRVRGLKPCWPSLIAHWHSRTFTGAWIETCSSTEPGGPCMRRTFTGAWIETGLSNISIHMP